jgi:hypothetical protein
MLEVLAREVNAVPLGPYDRQDDYFALAHPVLDSRWSVVSVRPQTGSHAADRLTDNDCRCTACLIDVSASNLAEQSSSPVIPILHTCSIGT